MGSGNFVGSFIDVARSFQGDPDYRTLRNVKDKGIKTRTDEMYSTYDKLRDQGQETLGKWIQDYLAGTKDAEARTGQEIATIDPYYSGGVENQLLSMRNEREAAVNAAAQRASRYALGNVARTTIGDEGGPGSYSTRLGQRYLTDIATNAALDKATTARGDWDFLQRAKLGLLGQRQSMADALVNRDLAPNQVSRQMAGADQSYLNNLAQMIHDNTIYGIQKKSTGLDRWRNASENLHNATMQLGSLIMGGMGGGMGGMGGAGGLTGAASGGGLSGGSGMLSSIMGGAGGGGSGGIGQILQMIMQLLGQQGGGAGAGGGGGSAGPYGGFGGGYAEGGIMPAGIPSLVGEYGPELVVPMTPTAVIPNQKAPMTYNWGGLLKKLFGSDASRFGVPDLSQQDDEKKKKDQGLGDLARLLQALGGGNNQAQFFPDSRPRTMLEPVPSFNPMAPGQLGAPAY